MKKFLFFALAAAFAFTSCTQDETLATAQPGAIAFEQAFVGKATRSNVDPSITKETLGAFNVYAFMDEPAGVVFDGEKVSSTDKGTTWTYINTAYWAEGHDYYFGALAPVDKYTLDSKGANTFGVGVVSFENDGKTDLLYAAATATTKDVDLSKTTMAPVALTFNHLLSKVKFSFVNALSNEDMTITVEGIKINNGYTKGSLALNQADWWTVPSWDFTEATANFVHNFGNVIAKGGTEIFNIPAYSKEEGESNEELLLFPAKDKTYKVEFTVKVWNGTVLAAEKTHEVDITTTLNMGYAYDFKATLDASNVLGEENAMQPIEFTVTGVNTWIVGGEVVVEEPKTNE